MNFTKPDIKIIIADDHEIFRDGFKLMLSKQTHIQLIAEAENGKELVELVEKHKPNVVVTDIKMPILDGIEAAKKITKANNDIGIIGLSMYDEDDLIVDMLEAGAKGFLIKNANKEQIVEAIETVYFGNPYYCKSTSDKLTHMIAKSKFNPYTKKEKPQFTDKELEIIQLICQQLTSKEIGEKLFLSPRTIEGHRVNIMQKMNVANPVGLVIYAVKNNLCSL